jgi:hypothetical protein
MMTSAAQLLQEVQTQPVDEMRISLLTIKTILLNVKSLAKKIQLSSF